MEKQQRHFKLINDIIACWPVVSSAYQYPLYFSNSLFLNDLPSRMNLVPAFGFIFHPSTPHLDIIAFLW